MHELWTQQIDEHLSSAEGVRSLLPEIAALSERMCDMFAAGGRLYTFGNGGSAADAQHLVAELVGRYQRERRPLPAVSLTTDPSVVTCISNDYDATQVFARQVSALAGPGDMVLAFSTSGSSPNVVTGLRAAGECGAMTVLLTGERGKPDMADQVICVPAGSTARIQEMHLLILHLVSEWVDIWAAENVLSVT